ncbi:elongator complex protein 4 [Lycorma delicatula]|uniref:elongator complex protein 4 n=1 Tax=Lycorma delicatula TaxID=130591 RepID=UPI003F516E96
MSVSFQLKSSKKIPTIPGTRTCTGKSQSLVSSGIVSLDCILGGGIPVGNILLVEEDEFSFFSQLFMKYFISEGVVCGHSSLLASLDVNTNKIISELPAPICPDRPPDHQNVSGSGGISSQSSDLKIAWRYHDTPVVQSAPSTVFGHQFDLANQMSSDIITNAEVLHWQPNHDKSIGYHNELLQMLDEKLIKGGHKLNDPSKPPRRTILRIAIHSIGSPLWGSPFHLPQFFYRLRSLIHTSLSVCLVTIPSRLIQAAVCALSGGEEIVNVISRCQHLSDCAIRLESLADNDEPAYAEYSGLLYLNKLSSTNVLSPHVPDTIDWAFKLRKRRFIIEKLHLPPELADSSQREQDESASIGCSSISKKIGADIDF